MSALLENRRVLEPVVRDQGVHRAGHIALDAIQIAEDERGLKMSLGLRVLRVASSTMARKGLPVMLPEHADDCAEWEFHGELPIPALRAPEPGVKIYCALSIAASSIFNR